MVVLLKLVFDSVPQPPAPVAPPNPTYPGGAAPSPAPQDPDAFEFREFYVLPLSVVANFSPSSVSIADPPLPPPTLEEVDVIREREIAWKGVSAIILLLLKWFKCSRKSSLPASSRRSLLTPHLLRALQTSSNSNTSANCW